jgi:hypothetical protein
MASRRRQYSVSLSPYLTRGALSLTTACCLRLLRFEISCTMSVASSLRPRSAAWRRARRSLTATGRPQEHSSTTR